MPDIDMKCKDCKNDFVFSEGEQEFFQRQFGADYTAPKRCSECRRKRREERDQGGHSYAR
jgi:primosomal protein N'